MTDATARQQAEQALRAWAQRRDQIEADRDPLIAAAIAAGVDKMTIHQITRIARTTTDRILDTAAASGLRTSEITALTMKGTAPAARPDRVLPLPEGAAALLAKYSDVDTGYLFPERPRPKALAPAPVIPRPEPHVIQDSQETRRQRRGTPIEAPPISPTELQARQVDTAKYLQARRPKPDKSQPQA